LRFIYIFLSTIPKDNSNSLITISGQRFTMLEEKDVLCHLMRSFTAATSVKRDDIRNAHPEADKASATVDGQDIALPHRWLRVVSLQDIIVSICGHALE